MEKIMKKIIVAAFQCESNSRAKQHPEKEDFEYFKGEDIFKKLVVKDVFEKAGYDVVPSIYAVALPSATVTEDIYFYYEKQIMQTVDAQPLTVFPAKLVRIAQATPTKLIMAKKTPNPVIIRIGLIERLVMPSNARASIFLRG